VNADDLEVGAQAQQLRDGGAAWTAVGIEMGCSSDTARRLAGAYLAHVDEQARKHQLSLF
jgi:hypothetical protein